MTDFNNMTTEELQAMVDTKVAESKANIDGIIKRAELTSKLATLSDPVIQQATADMMRTNAVTERLTHLVQTCSSIIDKLPINNPTTRKVRQFAGRKAFGMGAHVSLVHELLTGIQYSTEDHKRLMLEATQLNSTLVEATLDSFGQQPYYSPARDEIVQGMEANVPALRTNLALVGDSLGVTLDLHKVTDETMSELRKSSFAYAQTQQDEARKTAHLQSTLIVE